MAKMRFYPILWTLLFSFLMTSSSEAARVVHPVEVNIRVEDGEFKRIVIQEVTFAGEKIPLDPAVTSNLRKTTKVNLLPGRYRLDWVTQGDGGSFNPSRLPKTHRALVEIADDDAVVYLLIRADHISLY